MVASPERQSLVSVAEVLLGFQDICKRYMDQDKCESESLGKIPRLAQASRGLPISRGEKQL
jgi:hypothetical protein